MLLIQLTFVFGEAASLEKISSVFVSPAWGIINLCLYYFLISRLFRTCQVEPLFQIW